ncbi:outer membrane beta-barrel protein [uncultured Bacteroides sp.]|uniref:outer membrane beta-barrel protein n=1 Tax=uncultured Bacteroides sp. TaxID=162156 RepID=UPI002AA6B5CA|nr:outer membrane beta-barrel protein [uncultured Bacteroides sp.]
MVKQDKEIWTKKLRESLEDYSEPYPADGWQRLEKALLPSVPKRHIYPYRWWVAAGVMLLIAAGVSLYLLNSPVVREMEQNVPALATLPDALPQTKEPASTTSPTESMRIAQAGTSREKTNRATHSTAIGEKALVAEAVAENENSVTDDEKQHETNGNQPTEKEEVTSQEHSSRQVVRRPSSRDKLNIPVKSSSSKSRRWSVGVSVTNASGTYGGGENNTVQGAGYLLDDVTEGFVSIPENQTIVFKEGLPYVEYDVTNIEHHQPITFGLSVRKELSNRFSVETGVTYTLLSSDVKFQGSAQTSEQKLHYIGIPLRANWSFMNKDRFTLYLTGGGLVEKSVYGKLGSEKLTVKPLQWSLSGAVGAQLNTTKHIGIYIEPGVAYFFDDGSDVQTIRKETPFNLNIQAGIRFTY